MSTGVETARIPWWKEPTKDQWYAWWAAWLGWTLDAFDFTVFLLIMKPIADEFSVPVSEVAWILALTLWMRLVGAVASGWLADRVGRKTPLMISIFWYSICNFIAGCSATISGGAACCGSACCRLSRSFISAILSKSLRSGSRTAAFSAKKSARFA